LQYFLKNFLPIGKIFQLAGSQASTELGYPGLLPDKYMHAASYRKTLLRGGL